MVAEQRIIELLTYQKNEIGSGALGVNGVIDLQHNLRQIQNADGEPIFTAQSTGNFAEQTSEAVMAFLQMPEHTHLALEISPYVAENLVEFGHGRALNALVDHTLRDVLSTEGELSRENQFLIQRGLEYLGYDAGVVDGNIHGRNSMSAIAQYALDHPDVLFSINADILNDAHKYDFADNRSISVEHVLLRAAKNIPVSERERFFKQEHEDIGKAIELGEKSDLISRAQLFMTSMVDADKPETSSYDPKGIDGWPGARTNAAFKHVIETLEEQSNEQGLKDTFRDAHDDITTSRTPSAEAPELVATSDPSVIT